MTAGVLLIAALLALLMVGYVTRRHCRHCETRPDHLVGVDHVGTWEVCRRCGAARMCGDRRWSRRLPPSGVKRPVSING